jgi:hypothetical protein
MRTMNSSALELRRLDDVVMARRRSAVRDVVAHRASEQHRVLQHEADRAAQPVEPVVAQLDAVDRHAAGAGVVEAGDQAHDGGFAAAGGADNTHRLTGRNAEAHVLEHGFFRIVGEGDVLKHDFQADCPRLACVGSLRHDHVGIENRLDALDRDRGLSDRVAHLGELLHRLEELAQVGEEDGQLPHRHRVGEDERRATIEHESRAQRGGDRDGGGEEGLHLARRERGIDRRLADLLQVLLLDGFRAECLDDSGRLQTLLHHRHDVALVAAHLVRGALHGAVEAHHEQQQERRDGHRHEREIPVEPEHDAEHSEDGEQIDENGERSGRREALIVFTSSIMVERMVSSWSLS